MIEYVIVYAHTSDNFVPMVFKNRPAHLKGMLNLPGGKLEENEFPIQAACRELEEETGLQSLEEPIHVGVINCNDCKIHCVSMRVLHQHLKPRAGETEVAQWYHATTLDYCTNLMPNLRLVIPLCQSGMTGWFIDDYNDWTTCYYEVKLSLKESSFLPLTIKLQGVDYYDELRPEYDLTKLVPKVKK